MLYYMHTRIRVGSLEFVGIELGREVNSIADVMLTSADKSGFFPEFLF